MIINWRWFISKSLRDACEERKQVIKLLSAQKDLLNPSSIREIEEAIKRAENLWMQAQQNLDDIKTPEV